MCAIVHEKYSLSGLIEATSRRAPVIMHPIFYFVHSNYSQSPYTVLLKYIVFFCLRYSHFLRSAKCLLQLKTNKNVFEEKIMFVWGKRPEIAYPVNG